MRNIRPLNDYLQKEAEKCINELPDRLPEDLEALKTWIRQQPHLRARTDDQFLLAFLRGCKYSLEKAKSKLDKFYTLRTKYPECFRTTDVDDERFREIWRLGVFLLLPKPLNDNGPRILLMREGAYPPEKYSLPEVMRVFYCLQDITLIEDDYSVVNGCAAIIDLDNVNAGHLFQMTPSLMKKLSAYAEDAIPIRPQGWHFINTPMGFEKVFNVIKPILSKKQQNRLYVHGDKLESLYEHIPKKYWPTDYGGENDSIENIIAQWEKKFDEYRKYFEEEINYGCDENLRTGKPINFDESYGMEGSFRKLNVD